MKTLRNSFLLLGCLMLSALLTGCGSGDSASDGPVTTTRTAGSLEFTLSVPKSNYTRGETVPVTLSVKNIGTVRFILEYFDAAAQFQVAKDGAIVTSFHEPTTPGGGSGRNQPLDAGSTIVYQGEWKTDAVNSVAGNYSIVGNLIAEVRNGEGNIRGERILAQNVDNNASPITVIVSN